MANRRYIDFPIASSVGDSDIILIWQSGANKQTTKATFLSGLPENLDELNDVAISGLTNGQILRYDSVTGKWENTDQGNLDLNDLNDVSIVSPSNGQVLVYNSSTSKWENSSGGYVPYTGAVTTVNLGAQTIQAGSFVKAGGTAAQFLKADGSVDSNVYGTGTVTSVALTMPTAFSVANSPITTAGTLAVTGAGTVGQYIRGDGSLADFPESSGGGSSVSYYLHGSVAQGTIGGVAYKELNKVLVLGAGTDFTINADGYIASFITDAGDPNLLEIPAGNWNFETYFSASSNGGSPSFYVELYKVNSGGTATLIASNSTFPELIAFGTNIISYFSTLAVPTTALALTDRLAIRYYVTHSGRTITLHTEDNHLCQIITTFTTGLTALNGLTAQIQNFAVGTSGTDFAIASATATHTFNLPTASATNRGALSSADWTTFNNKTSNLGTVTSVGLSSATSGVTIGSTPVTTSGTITLAIATASGSQNGLLSSTDWTTFNGKQNALTNPVTGTGTSGQVAYFNGTSSITSESNLFWDETNNKLGIGTQFAFASNGRIVVKSGESNSTGIVLERNDTTDKLVNIFSETADGKIAISSSSTGNIKIYLDSVGASYFTGGNLGVGVSTVTTGKFVVKSGESNSSGIVLERGSNNEKLVNIFSETADGKIAIASSAITKILLNSAGTSYFDGGNVLIGTTTSGGYKCEIQTSSTNAALWVQTGGTTSSYIIAEFRTGTNAPALQILGNGVSSFGGNVGMGTASPTNGKLEIQQSTTTAALWVQTGGTTSSYVIADFRTGTNAPALQILGNGTSTFGGSVSFPHTTKSANYTLDATDYTVGFDCASNRTANLPDATTCAGRIYVIYQYNTNVGLRYVTLDGNGSQTIDGLTTVSLQYQSDYSSVMIQSNGSNWIIIADALYPSPL